MFLYYFPIFQKVPVYPRSAQSIGLEGQVLVEYTVDSMGFVKQPKVVDITNPLFEESAIKAVNAFRYAPRFVDGKPVSTAGVQHIISYKLE